MQLHFCGRAPWHCCWISCHNVSHLDGSNNTSLFFADDIHVACTFHTEQALLDGIRYFGYLVDEIKNLGLLLSPSKSCIVFRGSGRRYQYWRNKFLSTSADGGRLFHLPTSDGTLPIPVKRKCTYLGVVMSYENYELQTMQMRMKAGWNQYRRLPKWICGRGHISLALKLRIFQTCVIPCITYGLPFVGVTPTGLKTFRQQTMTLYCRLIGDIPHVTHHTSFRDIPSSVRKPYCGSFCNRPRTVCNWHFVMLVFKM